MLEEAGKVRKRSHTWNQEIPTNSAMDWHCKFSIRADRSLVASEDPEERGKIFLQLEPYGFDEEVYVIIQPHGQFHDFSS